MRNSSKAINHQVAVLDWACCSSPKARICLPVFWRCSRDLQSKGSSLTSTPRSVMPALMKPKFFQALPLHPINSVLLFLCQLWQLARMRNPVRLFLLLKTLSPHLAKVAKRCSNDLRHLPSETNFPLWRLLLLSLVECGRHRIPYLTSWKFIRCDRNRILGALEIWSWVSLRSLKLMAYLLWRGVERRIMRKIQSLDC